MLWLILLLLAVVPTQTMAQAHGDTIPVEQRCAEAISIAQSSPMSPEGEWAFQYIGRCGSDGGAALAALLSSNRFSADTLLLDRITWPARNFFDGQLFATSRDVALDASASVEARVLALRTLYFAVAPDRQVKYGHLARTDGAYTQCRGDAQGVGSPVTAGASLPADFGQEVADLVQQIIGDSTAPQEVQFAAKCIDLTDPESAVLPGVIGSHEQLPSGSITLSYVCGNTFQVTNPFEVDLDLSYEVVGSTETGSVSLDAKQWGGPDTTANINTVSEGNVRLYWDDVLVSEATNDKVPCSGQP